MTQVGDPNIMTFLFSMGEGVWTILSGGSKTCTCTIMQFYT